MSVIINGNVYEGNSVVIKNGKIIVDGKNVTPDSKEINIVVNGNIETLDVDACSKIDVTGDIGKIKTMSGDVKCNNVKGDISTMSGDVSCKGNIVGNVKTQSGDISHGG